MALGDASRDARVPDLVLLGAARGANERCGRAEHAKLATQRSKRVHRRGFHVRGPSKKSAERRIEARGVETFRRPARSPDAPRAFDPQATLGCKIDAPVVARVVDRPAIVEEAFANLVAIVDRQEAIVARRSIWNSARHPPKISA